MDHRSFAVLAVVCFALEATGCVSKSKRARREEILMPLQTGSTLQRRVMIESESVPEKPTEKPKKKDSKRNSPKPSAPAPEPSPPRPEDESTTPPDRFR
jgi:hypothetical protein